MVRVSLIVQLFTAPFLNVSSLKMYVRYAPDKCNDCSRNSVTKYKLLFDYTLRAVTCLHKWQDKAFDKAKGYDSLIECN